MELTLSGLIASMVIMVFVIAMLGLIFNLTLNVLNQQQEYAAFYAEVQNITDILDSILTQSVWNDELVDAQGKPRTTEIDPDGKFVYLKFFSPVGMNVVTQTKKLEFVSVGDSVIIRFDGKDLVRTSKIKYVSISLQTKKEPSGLIIDPKFLEITFIHNNGKIKYSVPLLTALSSSS